MTELELKSINFYHLQFQFMSEVATESLFNVFFGLYLSNNYKKNKYTKKVKSLLFTMPSYKWTNKDIECLSTHFALQLSGIEE